MPPARWYVFIYHLHCSGFFLEVCKPETKKANKLG